MKTIKKNFYKDGLMSMLGAFQIIKSFQIPSLEYSKFRYHVTIRKDSNGHGLCEYAGYVYIKNGIIIKQKQTCIEETTCYRLIEPYIEDDALQFYIDFDDDLNAGFHDKAIHTYKISGDISYK